MTDMSAARPVHRRTPVGWILGLVGFALMFSAVLPAAALLGPSSRPAEPGQELTMIFGTVQAPQGWDVSIPQTSLTSPTVTRGDMRVTFSSGLWEGSTESLLERVVQLNVDDPATAAIPDAVEPEDRAERTVHCIVVDGPESQGEIYVIRELSVAAVMTVRGDPQERERHHEDLDAMVDSVWLEELDLTVDLEDLDDLEKVGS